MGFFGKDDKKAVAAHKQAASDLRKIEKKIGFFGTVDEDSKLGKEYQAANDRVRETEKDVSGWRRHHLYGN